MLRQIPGKIRRYRAQLVELLETGTTVYRTVAQLPEAPPPDAIRVVHMSDVHLSPFAFPLAQALVEQSGAEAVLDTGDLVDWGTPPERVLARQIPSLGVPYVYIEGNHDSDGIAAAVARQANAVVLTAHGGPREVAGLTLVGFGDPRFTPDKRTGDDHHPQLPREAGEAFADRLRTSGVRPDIALVHAPRAARPLAGLVPLVLAGDTHRRRARHEHGTTTLVQGSTGGSGLRGVQVDPPAPISLSVLHLDRTTRTLWGVDEVTLDGLGGLGMSVVRRPLAALLGDATPSRVEVAAR
ncbi:metallophosphoesterase [Jatrophihabitans endophyticus]|uniref:metallophosphoesterase family protein n=1 Tax=Jatrophihabitans endophyticus TaxID=1206085 RepID=UPI0019F30C76|nr:metallophosphoesterase [Jatrophihabitans endophyticus]MBE7189884.1 metallophosphoesterase [Jatrophihabitans endophyticus]